MSRHKRLTGTFIRTFHNLLMAEHTPKRCAHFYDGHVYTGHRSLHRTPSGRRLHKLYALQYIGICNCPLTIEGL